MLKNTKALRVHEKIHKNDQLMKWEIWNHTYKDKNSLKLSHRMGCPKKMICKKNESPSHVKIYDNKSAECLICYRKYKDYKSLLSSHYRKGWPSTSQKGKL